MPGRQKRKPGQIDYVELRKSILLPGTTSDGDHEIKIFGSCTDELHTDKPNNKHTSESERILKVSRVTRY